MNKSATCIFPPFRSLPLEAAVAVDTVSVLRCAFMIAHARWLQPNIKKNKSFLGFFRITRREAATGDKIYNLHVNRSSFVETVFISRRRGWNNNIRTM